jgi:hypothetical protein
LLVGRSLWDRTRPTGMFRVVEDETVM